MGAVVLEGTLIVTQHAGVVRFAPGAVWLGETVGASSLEEGVATETQKVKKKALENS